jgi:CRISPR-associated endoribonuclease Cas6
MITKYEIHLDYQSKEPPNCFWGYNMYGVLMQKLPENITEQLHESTISPLSQYVTVDKVNNALIWHVTVVGDINGQMEEVLTQTKEYHLAGHDSLLKVRKCEKIMEMSYIDFAKMYLHEMPYSRRIRIITATPVSFKTGGEYALFPTVELTYKSAIQKWNAYAHDIVIDDDSILEQRVGCTKIVSYRLNSFYYQIKGVKIPSFSGEITLSIKGPEALVRLADLLLHYLECSGLGIKCALGMGGIKTANCTEQLALNIK